jgi:hypothetical protein
MAHAQHRGNRARPPQPTGKPAARRATDGPKRTEPRARLEMTLMAVGLIVLALLMLFQLLHDERELWTRVAAGAKTITWYRSAISFAGPALFLGMGASLLLFRWLARSVLLSLILSLAGIGLLVGLYRGQVREERLYNRGYHLCARRWSGRSAQSLYAASDAAGPR